MTLTLTVEMGNAAFTANPDREAARILRSLADSLEKDLTCQWVAKNDLSEVGWLWDLNGGRVGTWKVGF